MLTYCRKGQGVVVFATATGGLSEAVAKFVYTGAVPPEWSRFADAFQELKQLNQDKYRQLAAGRSGLSAFEAAVASTVYGETGVDKTFPMVRFAM